ncbi:hypothetical protein ABFS82_06G092200 [Erythranthe guttata]
MSFQDLESGRRPMCIHQIDHRDPSRPVAAGVFKINTAVSAYKRLVSTIGTPKDTPELRRKLRKTRLEIGQTVNETSAALDLLRETDKSPRVDARKKIGHAKLTKDYEAVLKEFEKAQVLEAERDTNFAAHPPLVTNITLQPGNTAGETGIKISLNGNSTSLFIDSNRSQAVIQLENEINLNEAIIEEREEGIREVQQQIDEVNEIFRDLALLVREQGALIDDVSLNIERSDAATTKATMLPLLKPLRISKKHPIAKALLHRCYIKGRGPQRNEIIPSLLKSIVREIIKELRILWKTCPKSGGDSKIRLHDVRYASVFMFRFNSR